MSAGSSPISSRKSVPPFGRLEDPASGGLCVGVGSLFASEEFRLEERRGNRRAVHGYERFAASRRERVKNPGENLLAGPRVARDQDRRIKGRHLPDGVRQRPKGGRRGEKRFQGSLAVGFERFAKRPVRGGEFVVSFLKKGRERKAHLERQNVPEEREKPGVLGRKRPGASTVEAHDSEVPVVQTKAYQDEGPDLPDHARCHRQTEGIVRDVVDHVAVVGTVAPKRKKRGRNRHRVLEHLGALAGRVRKKADGAPILEVDVRKGAFGGQKGREREKSAPKTFGERHRAREGLGNGVETFGRERRGAGGRKDGAGRRHALRTRRVSLGKRKSTKCRD